MRLKKEELNRFAEDSNAPISCRVYGEPDGLPVTECTSGSQPGGVSRRRMEPCGSLRYKAWPAEPGPA